MPKAGIVRQIGEMIVSHGRRYIFVHIPKTAGTALALALEARAMADDLMIGDTPKALRRRKRVDGMRMAGRKWKHATLSDGIGLYTPEEARRYFTFTLVRNPWDRLVSYYHWLRGQGFDHGAVHAAKTYGFGAFLAQPLIRRSLQAHSYASYMRLPDGGLCCSSFIRLEHFVEDVAALEAHLGFALGVLPVANRSEREADYRRYYDSSSVDLVAEICAEDIAQFNYKFNR
ncbi:sulfotransferase family 2 domain-containing protein [Thioclava sp. GXIMD2076]|uniref:sulfotransferase family 2 domain-containing protein n=1 Tax=Thioclava sp. GXIMD2076 TaxID=3131931 RepID=UPI0030CE59C3